MHRWFYRGWGEKKKLDILEDKPHLCLSSHEITSRGDTMSVILGNLLRLKISYGA